MGISGVIRVNLGTSVLDFMSVFRHRALSKSLKMLPYIFQTFSKEGERTSGTLEGQAIFMDGLQRDSWVKSFTLWRTVSVTGCLQFSFTQLQPFFTLNPT